MLSLFHGPPPSASSLLSHVDTVRVIDSDLIEGVEAGVRVLRPHGRVRLRARRRVRRRGHRTCLPPRGHLLRHLRPLRASHERDPRRQGSEVAAAGAGAGGHQVRAHAGRERCGVAWHRIGIGAKLATVGIIRSESATTDCHRIGVGQEDGACCCSIKLETPISNKLANCDDDQTPPSKMPRPQRSRRQSPRSAALPYTRTAARRRDNSMSSLPQLAVGVFHLQQDGPAMCTRRRTPPLLRFLPVSPARPPTSTGSPFIDGAAALDLDHARPVASRNGRLVLELRREAGARSVTFCVCSPMTGDAAVVLPPLSGEDRPAADDYGCALLAGDDDESFRLLLVYNDRRRGSTALRCYSSDTGRWGAEARSAVDVSTREMRHLGSAAVLRGVAFWPLDHGALGVRADADDPDLQAMDVHLLPYDCPHDWLKTRLLGVSPDDRLFLVYLGIRAGDGALTAKVSYFDIPGGDFRNGRKGSSCDEEAILVHQMRMNYLDLLTLKLRWIGEKSGFVLFTMGGRGGRNGAYALNLREATVEKLADEGYSWANAVGFEIWWTSRRQWLTLSDSKCWRTAV